MAGPAFIYIMWSTSGVASTRTKVVYTEAWNGNLAIIANKHPIGITLNTNSNYCINFQDLTLDFIFSGARLSYLVTNIMQVKVSLPRDTNNSLNIHFDLVNIFISEWFLDVCNAK